ncbi:patatin-like phospholipase family protein [Georgenia subflava]|nr:patatin-like phospholipase family protein [Georgenia subflava]
MTTYPADPALECDVIMKGGITSGVIYPRAVCELAKTYRLRSVGGTSAGAIAAAAAAAAELGRDAGGFDELERLPHDITAESPAGGSTLFRLFQPSRKSAPLFRAFTAGMGHHGPAGTLRTGVALVTGFWAWTLLGMLPGVVVVVLAATGEGAARWAGVVAGVVLALLGAAVGIGAGVLRVLGGPVPRAGFGICTGMPGAGSGGAPALTPWLHERLQTMAGRTGQAPVTFGDLAGAGVELRTMTTNLTRHQPMAMPWEEREYFFDPAEMRALFPEDVVAWMEEHPPPGRPSWDTDLLRRQALPLRPLPAGPDLPVLVATRMSLSFPLLITAVPLHAVDYADPVNRGAADAADDYRRTHPDATVEEAAAAVAARRFDVNWFSDGGICSNLPVHFFDAPLPTRPTFAVDLAPFPAGRTKSADERENSYLPTTNLGGLLRRWYRIPTTGLGSLGAFLFSVVETARGWVDEAQLVMPGYRDRVVTIWHDEAEGGMNLAMPPDVVAGLAARGRGGAAKVVERFAGPVPGSTPGPGWENHRWIRFRTATAGLDEWVGELATKYAADVRGTTPYRDLAGPGAAAPLPSYPLGAGRREAVNTRTGGLLELAQRWAQPPEDAFTEGAPRPRPRLRLVADDDPGGR